MAETLLERSARFIDEGIQVGAFEQSPMDQSLHEVADDIAVVCSMAHVWSLRTDEGLVVFDTSMEMFGAAEVESLRRWSPDPITSLVFTHGHIDHVGGAPAFLADAAERGHRRPKVLAHENVPERFERYQAMATRCGRR